MFNTVPYNSFPASSELLRKLDVVENEIDTLKSGLNSKLPFRPITSGSLHDIKESGMYYLTGAVSDRPAGLGGMYIVYAYNQDLLVGLYIGYAIDQGDHQIAIVSYHDNNWSITDIKSTTRN